MTATKENTAAAKANERDDEGNDLLNCCIVKVPEMNNSKENSLVYLWDNHAAYNFYL